MAHLNMDNVTVEPDSTVEIQEHQERLPTMLELARKSYEESYMQGAQRLNDRVTGRNRARARLEELRTRRETLEEELGNRHDLLRRTLKCRYNIQEELKQALWKKDSLSRQLATIKRRTLSSHRIGAVKKLDLQQRDTLMKSLLGRSRPNGVDPGCEHDVECNVDDVDELPGHVASRPTECNHRDNRELLSDPENGDNDDFDNADNNNNTYEEHLRGWKIAMINGSADLDQMADWEVAIINANEDGSGEQEDWEVARGNEDNSDQDDDVDDMDVEIDVVG